MTTGEKIKFLRLKKGISAEDLSAAIGVSRSTIFRYENGEIAKLPVDRIEIIAKMLNTTTQYLMGWEDEYGLTPDNWDSIRALAKTYRRNHHISLKKISEESGCSVQEIMDFEEGHEAKIAVSYLFAICVLCGGEDPYKLFYPYFDKLYNFSRFELSHQDEAISKVFNVIPVGRQGYRPIYGTISAGLGHYVDGEELLGWESVDERYDTEDYFFLRVNGDSMSPKIDHGDLLLIKKQDSVDSGDIGAFLIDGEEGFVKKVKYDTDYITLISLNPAYEPMVFLGEDVLRVRVVGKVIKIVTNL